MARRHKYLFILDALEEDEVYSPALIARFAEAKGLLADLLAEEPDKALVMQRIRIALAHLPRNHHFPDFGDKMVSLEGRAPTPGWYGWRWKEIVPQRY